MAILQEHQGGVTAEEAIRRNGISLDTFCCWKRQYGGMTHGELQRRQEYNTDRPHLSLGDRTPAEYAGRFTPEAGPSPLPILWS